MEASRTGMLGGLVLAATAGLGFSATAHPITGLYIGAGLGLNLMGSEKIHRVGQGWLAYASARADRCWGA
jgi:hypothetical protein